LEELDDHDDVQVFTLKLCSAEDNYDILGIDPGTARMGYGILGTLPEKENQFNQIRCYYNNTRLRVHKRLSYPFFNELNDLVKGYSPEVMILERIF